MKKRKLKQLPVLLSDEEAEHFVDTADLSEYDLSVFKPMKFEFTAKDGRINMRLPADLLSAVKKAAAKQKMPYQRFIRHVLSEAVQPSKS